MELLETYLIKYWHNISTSKKIKSCKVEFYKYRSTSIKIHKLNDHIIVRFNSRLKDAPVEVLKAGGREMIHRLLRQRPLATDRVIFQQYLNELKPERHSGDCKIPLLPPKGKSKNLDTIFDKVKKELFPQGIFIKEYGWSAKPMRTYYANYRREIDRITINLAFDDPLVPDQILEYLLYHEALHTVYPPRFISSRLSKHTPEFRRTEREFPNFAEIKKWLKTNGSKTINNSLKTRRIKSL